ncbi:hypothetical protein [Nakamurella aerolata]|uniref:Uncharacterized protein n=1 Tax=Nakamurella aerolata TaxID=1656892 RepID=A0A849AFB3_9ACTN|nr:hypothetical protein [Nakamurella aerolata]NNG35532.1 hypothetical protein [Nakamurella aerolata]
MNRAKSDQNARRWLPPLFSARCSYMAHQVGVKTRYGLSVSRADRDAIRASLDDLPWSAIAAALIKAASVATRI